MPRFLILFAACLLAAFSGCSESETPAPPSATTKASPTPPAVSPAEVPVDPCTLLTSEEIRSIQGEELQSTKKSGQSEGELAFSQCFFALPTFINSISLQVAQKGKKAGARDPRQAWREMFSPEKLREMETEGGKKKLPPRRIPDLGEEAFWAGGPAGGLYVLRGNQYIRISVGGADDEETKIRKSTALVRLVLERLARN